MHWATTKAISDSTMYFEFVFFTTTIYTYATLLIRERGTGDAFPAPRSLSWEPSGVISPGTRRGDV